MKLDVKKFQKVDSNDKHTILQHPNGHQIKVAHNGLSKEMREELDELPIHKAKGGKISFKEFSKNYEASKASKPAESSNTMPGSPTEAKNAYTEPQDIGTKGYTEKGNYNDVVLAALKKEAPPFGPLGTAPKQHYPPCINPSCKSYGKPHPNCRCYGGVSEHSGVGEAGHFAEGGKVESHFCSEDRPHDPGCQYYAEGTPQQPVTPMSAPSPVQTLEQEQPQMNTNVETQAAPAEQNPIDQNPANPPLNPSPANGSAADYLSMLTGEDQAHQIDQDRGHIKPETYQDLFDKKGTLGKIGTLFGLMVGGAGSGLAHQDNALLNMMNNEIRNDLEAQKQSASNRQNLYSLTQKDLANQAGIKMTDVQRQTLADGLATMRGNRVALGHIMDIVKKLPPDKQAQYLPALGMLRETVNKENFGIGQKAAVNAAALGFAMPEGGGQPNTTAMKAGILGPEFKELGTDIENKTLPGVPGRANRPIEPDDRKKVLAMNVLSDKAKDLMDFASKHKGTLSPATRAVAQQKADELVNFYNQSISNQVLTHGHLAWLEEQISKNPTGIVTQLMGNQQRLKEIKDSNDHRKNLLLKSYGYKPEEVSSGTDIKTVNGVKWKRGPNGEAVRVD